MHLLVVGLALLYFDLRGSVLSSIKDSINNIQSDTLVHLLDYLSSRNVNVKRVKQSHTAVIIHVALSYFLYKSLPSDSDDTVSCFVTTAVN